MEKRFGTAARAYLLLLAIAGWFGLIVQFDFLMEGKAAPVPELLIRYFTFFTILTNLLIAVGSTIISLMPRSGWGKFFSKATTLTAMTVNIVIVGAVYNLLLRSLASFHGIQSLANELLHLVIPVLFFMFWLIVVPKGRLKWSNVWLWMIYPLVYLAIVLIRGELSGYYPYPFLNVTKLGYPQTLLNCGGVAAVFIIISLIFVGIGKLTGKKTGR